jgi:glycosyltransferase involved in cell wall biosynthesis
VNIWLVNHYANAPDEPGDARHWSHARELIRRGHKVAIVASSFHHLKHEQIHSVSHRRIVHQAVQDVPFIWIPIVGYKSDSILRVAGFFEFALRVACGRWADTLERPDLILGSSPHPFAALAAERLAARYQVPFLLELRDAWPYVLTEVGGYSARHPFVILVDRTMRFLYKRAAGIVLFSRDSLQSFEQMGGDLKKVIWLPHGVDLTLTPAPEPPPNDGIFTVKYIGAHNQWNSLDTILDAAKYLQAKGLTTIQFRFIGDGVQKPRLQMRAIQEGITNVHFDDPVPKGRIAQVLYDADAFILNNRVDGVSRNWMSFNKVYEYLAARRPVIFGSCTRINPVQESGGGILVEAGNHIEMAQAVELLASLSQEHLDTYGLRGRQHIEAHYSIKAIVDRFEALAYKLTGQASPCITPSSPSRI